MSSPAAILQCLHSNVHNFQSSPTQQNIREDIKVRTRTDTANNAYHLKLLISPCCRAAVSASSCSVKLREQETVVFVCSCCLLWSCIIYIHNPVNYKNDEWKASLCTIYSVLLHVHPNQILIFVQKTHDTICEIVENNFFMHCGPTLYYLILFDASSLCTILCLQRSVSTQEEGTTEIIIIGYSTENQTEL